MNAERGLTSYRQASEQKMARKYRQAIKKWRRKRKYRLAIKRKYRQAAAAAAAAFLTFWQKIFLLEMHNRS